MKELVCPECGNDMKEYVTKFICRNCKFLYVKQFQIIPKTKTSIIDYVPPLKEGKYKKGGFNPRPTTPKPNIRPGAYPKN